MSEKDRSLNFIEQIVEKDVLEAKNDGRVQTRFPPEPNGYLHIGHVKAICLDFGIAKKYNGICNLRFDDTNPSKEDVEYVDSIQADIRWLGFQWGNVYYASDYFDRLFELAIYFIEQGKAYVDEQTSEQIAQQKGTPTEPGVESPYRNRPIEENLRLFRAMQAGEIEEGAMVLRAKIDMANPNMHFRDPIIYRIIKSTPHHRTGRKWNVYPMYDFAHGQSDYFEGVTHSICTLEFEVHRPLYDYFLDQFVKTSYRPHQYEFNRLNLTHTVMSKRKMLQLVKEGVVAGWDDPRMPTVCGLRRRGYTATALKSFIDKIGYTKVEGTIDYSLLEHTIREELKETAPRLCAIFDPIKLIITNYDKRGEVLVSENIDGCSVVGTREVAFGKELYIERADFMMEASDDFYRLSPNGREVRLKGAYIIQATGFERDDNGNVTTVYATYDPLSLSGTDGGKRKTKSTINWVETNSCEKVMVRMYDNLFEEDFPSEENRDITTLVNPHSLQVTACYVEGYIKREKKAVEFKDGIAQCSHYQFLKKGYFVIDPDTSENGVILNLTASLKDNKIK